MEKVNLADAFAQIDEHWAPRIAGALNGQHVKLAKLQGDFVWHRHEEEDELFLIVKGHLTIKLRDRDVTLEEGEFFYRAARRRAQAGRDRRSSRAPL